MVTQVRISDIGLYLRCPRLVYFDSMGKLQRKNSAQQLILKNLMLGIIGKTDLASELKESLARLEQELPMAYEIEPEEIGPACRELEARIPEISASLLPHLGNLIPCEVEVDLRSEKLGLSGKRKCSMTFAFMREAFFRIMHDSLANAIPLSSGHWLALRNSSILRERTMGPGILTCLTTFAPRALASYPQRA